MVLARRAFVVGWIVLAVFGALNHTIAERLFGKRFELALPQLEYGYVMFNKNPRQVQVYSYARADGVRHDLADLVRTPSPGYKRARVAIDAAFDPRVLDEICFRATRGSTEKLTFFVDEYDLDVDARAPVRTRALACDAHGLASD